jgi:hypothetical protein
MKNLVRETLVGVFIAANLAITAFFGCTAIVEQKILPAVDAGPDCTGVATGQDCPGLDGNLDWVCREGICEPSSCGDDFVDARRGEECDEASLGCDRSSVGNCTWKCTSNGDCDDGEECTGQETCDLSKHTCDAAPTLPPNGASCQGGAGTCQSLVCVVP